MNISPEALRELVENNPKLVTRKRSDRFPDLYVIKYSHEVFYDAKWGANDLLVECRGLIVDADYNVVVKPFTKAFNYQENGTTIDPDELCTVVRKVNGFLGVATLDPSISDELIISTTGSLDSDFVDLAYKHIKPLEEAIKSKFFTKMTFLFEICDESDPHIIKEESGAWLIGVNTYHSSGIYDLSEPMVDIIARIIGAMRPELYDEVKFSDVLEMARTCEHEGFMVIGKKTTLKLKSPYYLITKWFARMSEKKFNTLVRDNNKAEAYRRFDEEYYELIDYVFNNVFMWRMLSKGARVEFIREFLNRKKQYE